MKELIQRFKAKTPRFFKKLRAVGLSTSALGGGLLVIPYFPTEYTHIAQTLAWVGAAVALVAQTAAENPEELER